ncbi:MAG: CapA family protein, partial [Alphaproteobacteria bacterium]|nr:CapA family protein [Alphaproteobacteria bacterium]
FPFPEDMAALQQILETARASVDVLVVSFHWGKSVRPATLMDYEVSYGRAAVEFGADLVLGHHHHLLRAVEIHKQKPIFFGLSHFAFDMPGLEEALGPDRIERLKKSGEFAIYPREGYPLLPFHPDARMTAIAVILFDNRSIGRQLLIPCLINPKNQPVPVDVASEMGRRIRDYLDRITKDVGLRTMYAPSETRIAGHSALEVRPGPASGD